MGEGEEEEKKREEMEGTFKQLTKGGGEDHEGDKRVQRVSGREVGFEEAGGVHSDDLQSVPLETLDGLEV